MKSVSRGVLIVFAVAAGGAAWAFLGLQPKLSPGWLWAIGTGLLVYASSAGDKARADWGRGGWNYDAVIGVAQWGLAMFFAAACYLLAFGMRMAQGE